MKFKYLIFLFILLLVSCGEKEYIYYYKCFFIAETSFEIEGEVFVNNNLTEKAEFELITVKTDSVKNWEIAGTKTTENKFILSVDINANGAAISEETINPEKEGNYIGHLNNFPENFPYCTLIFFVDGRRARGATEPEFGELYFYVYVAEAIDLSGTQSYSMSNLGTNTYYYYYDLNFDKPGWYKIYYSKDIPIENKPSFSSGANTKIRAPK